MKAQAGEVRGEARLRAGDAKVGRERQAETAADGRAVHRRHHGLVPAEYPHGFHVELTRLVVELLRPPGFPALKIRAGAEMFALGAENDCATIRFCVELLVGVGDLADEIVVEKVIRGAIDLHRCDVIGDGQVDIVAHW